MQTYKEIEKYHRVLTDNKTKCKCGHSVAIPPHLNKVICSWCRNYVFRTPKDEFKHRMKEKMINDERK